MAGPHFWRVVGLLLRAAARRATGRRRRQIELLQQRSGRRSVMGGGFGFAIVAVLMVLLNAGAAFGLRMGVFAAERAAAELRGVTVVDAQFDAKVARVERMARDRDWSAEQTDRALQRATSLEGQRIATLFGGDPARVTERLRQTVRDGGAESLVELGRVAPGLSALPRTGRLPALVGSAMLLLWLLMLVCQGEGLELDMQRRRHPMWEFLFSHPVPPGAVFLAEMLSPMVANPVFYGAPLFVGFAFGSVYGDWLGAAATLLAGVPITIAAACAGRALEVAVTLRAGTRSRGAIMGLFGWAGTAALLVMFLSAVGAAHAVTAIAPYLAPLTVLPWPWLGLLLGQWGGSFSFPLGIATCVIGSAAVAGAAIRFAVWAAGRGLASPPDAAAATIASSPAAFGRHALYRKELLWLRRDRSAVVQAFLVPLTMAAYQSFNMRGALSHAQGGWSLTAGAGILFGVYFLGTLGPRSLASEGQALWLSLTWPQGLEALLRAKAWLWSMIADALVGLVLAYALYRYPADWWRILLVAAGWAVFARSLADKTVTLATITSESGETQKVPYGRRAATQLGTFTFAIGVYTRQWPVAVMGIVYAAMTAAAMWQNFRARLPYLFDPWSERLPPPPTLMHAMIGISVLVEGSVVCGALSRIFVGAEAAAFVQAACYLVWAVIVSLAMARFLHRRHVAWREIWTWPRAGAAPVPLPAALVLGAVVGVALGGAALLYLAAAEQIPSLARTIAQGRDAMDAIPHARAAYLVMAVLVAPFAEEFLFRGLLYRALDREWGGWRAVLGSAAFFAMYHPPLSWLPVAALGATNAVIFRRTGRLAPAVALHVAYNAVVLGMQ